MLLPTRTGGVVTVRSLRYVDGWINSPQVMITVAGGKNTRVTLALAEPPRHVALVVWLVGPKSWQCGTKARSLDTIFFRLDPLRSRKS